MAQKLLLVPETVYNNFIQNASCKKLISNSTAFPPEEAGLQVANQALEAVKRTKKSKSSKKVLYD